MTDQIIALNMPKWGLSMQEGTIVDWWKGEGATISEGDELADIETSKITNVFEAPFSGTLRRIVAQKGETLPVGAILAVLADQSVPDADIDAFVADAQANFVPEAEEAGGLAMESVAIGGGRTLRAARAGSGDATPAVFLHGFGGDHSGWTLQLAAISADRPVIALDLPGHGASTKDVGDGSLAALAADVGAALDALDLTQVHLVGHSLGGATALAVALAHPDRIASLSLLCPAGLPGTALNPAYVDGFLSARRGRELAKTLELLFADPSLATREMAEDILKSKRLDGVEEALAAIRAGMADPAFAASGAQIAALKAPLLVIASRADQVVGAPDEAALPAGTRVVWATRSGHMPMVEEAELVSGALAARMA